jgi:hypothetical protein
VLYGFQYRDAAEAAGLIPEDVDIIQTFHIQMLAKARVNKLNEEQFTMAKIYRAISVLFGGDDDNNPTYLYLPFPDKEVVYNIKEEMKRQAAAPMTDAELADIIGIKLEG